MITITVTVLGFDVMGKASRDVPPKALSMAFTAAQQLTHVGC